MSTKSWSAVDDTFDRRSNGVAFGAGGTAGAFAADAGGTPAASISASALGSPAGTGGTASGFKSALPYFWYCKWMTNPVIVATMNANPTRNPTIAGPIDWSLILWSRNATHVLKITTRLMTG